MQEAWQQLSTAAARPVHRRRWLLRGLGLLLVAVAVIERLRFLAHAAPTDFDDAYTYLRYAQHWLAGEGIVWNSGEPAVYGVTSLLHLAVVTVIRWAFPDLAMWRVLQVASGAAAIGLLAGLTAIAALLSRHRRLSRNWIFACGVLLSLIAFRDAFGFHAATGMDTMLSALSNTVLAFFALQLGAKPTPARMVLAVAAAAVSVLARPDNLICATLCPGLAIALLSPRPRGKALVVYGALTLAVLGGLAVAVWRLLGTPVPLSFFVKQPWYYRGFAGEFGWNPFRFLDVFLVSAWPFLVASIVFADRRGLRRSLVLLVPALLTLAVLFRFNQIMGHLGRFYYPMLPFFAVAGVLQFDRFLSQPPRPKALLVRSALAVAVVVAVHAGSRLGADHYAARGEAETLSAVLAPVAGYHVAATVPLPEIDSWQSARHMAAVAVAAPAGTRIAMSEHGLPGALAPQIVIIDVLGLHDARFARHGFTAAELFRRAPELIWLPHSDHVDMLREILGSEELWTHYRFYPDAFFHGVAIRSDGPHAAALASALSAAWDAAYPGVSMFDYRATRDD